METITCEGMRIEAEEIEQIGGEFGDLSNFTDILYRDSSGRYFLKEERSYKVPNNAKYQMPRDREWFDRMTQSETETREISEKEAMQWYIEMFMNDEKLKERFLGLIERFA